MFRDAKLFGYCGSISGFCFLWERLAGITANPVKLKYAAGQTMEFCFAGAGSRGSTPFAGGT